MQVKVQVIGTSLYLVELSWQPEKKCSKAFLKPTLVEPEQPHCKDVKDCDDVACCETEPSECVFSQPG